MIGVFDWSILFSYLSSSESTLVYSYQADFNPDSVVMKRCKFD